MSTPVEPTWVSRNHPPRTWLGITFHRSSRDPEGSSVSGEASRTNLDYDTHPGCAGGETPTFLVYERPDQGIRKTRPRDKVTGEGQVIYRDKQLA